MKKYFFIIGSTLFFTQSFGAGKISPAVERFSMPSAIYSNVTTDDPTIMFGTYFVVYVWGSLDYWQITDIYNMLQSAGSDELAVLLYMDANYTDIYEWSVVPR